MERSNSGRIELFSEKREVFGPVVPTLENVKPVGYRWVFVRKRNENNEIVRYKAHLVAQGFSQRPGIDYEETYSPVMDAITFRYLIHLAVSEGLEMNLMNVVTTCLYGSIDCLKDLHCLKQNFQNHVVCIQ